MDKCLKNPTSEDPSTNNMINGHKHSCSLDDRTFTIFIDHSEHNGVDKKSVLVLCKTLMLFVNTLAVDDKYSLYNRDNLTQPIHILLSKKRETFFRFFPSILKSILRTPKR